MTFAAPGMLALGVAWWFALALAALWERRARRAALAKLGDAELVAQLVASSSPARRRLKRGLVGLAGALLAVVAARPQMVATTEVALRGLDVVVALDVSTSMLVGDAPGQPGDAEREPTRLALARALASALLEELPEDRFGPVVFAGAAVHFPLTADREVARQFLHDIGPADLPRGSDVAEALRVARCLLHRELYAKLGCTVVLGRAGDGGRPRDGTDAAGDAASEELVELEERARAIVLFTDGGDDLAEAIAGARAERDARVPLVVVGLGSSAGGQVFDIDDEGRRVGAKRDASGAPVVSRRNDAPLRALVEAAGGSSRYVVASADADVGPILAALRELGRGLTAKKARQRQDLSHPFALAAILILLCEAAIGTRRRR